MAEATGELAKLQLGIGGMSCSFCVGSIEKAYRRLPGVVDVSVSLSHQEGLIVYDPTMIDEGRLRSRLEEIGYTLLDTDRLDRFAQEEAQLRSARNRLLAGAALSAAMAAGMAVMAVVEVRFPALPWILLAVALTMVFGIAWPIVVMAWTSLRNRILNQHVLLEAGAFGALVGGIGAMVAPGVFTRSELFGPMTGVVEFFGAAVLITTYHLLSGYASLRLRTRTSQAVRRLLDLRPPTARVVRGGDEVTVPVEDVAVGELVRIRPGESIPVDGQVVEGASAVDTSLVTGEPIPAEKGPGDEVIGGSVNGHGTLLVRVARVGEESFLEQVARQVEEARALKPTILQLVDRILARYVPAVLVLAAASLVGWTLVPWLLGAGADPARGLFAALAVLVMGYPCALGMATPLALIRGGGMAAERGILMRAGEAFQVAGGLTHVALDKTGTITEGRPVVVEVVGGAEVLRLAAAVEAPTEHPLGRAITEAHVGDLPAVDGFRAVTGRGVEGIVEGRTVRVGRPGWAGPASVLDERIQTLRARGATVVTVEVDGETVGAVAVADPPKADAAAAIARMRDEGRVPVMLTGDHPGTARAVAEAVGIAEVHAGLLPEEKATWIRELQARGRRVAMVGDGINDAPALVQADVGIAIASGTDVAIESADVVIVGDRLMAVPETLEIASASYRKTKENLAVAFLFNGVGMAAAVTGLVSPVFAMVAMVLSVSGVLGNSFGGRLVRRRRRGTASTTARVSRDVTAGGEGL